MWKNCQRSSVRGSFIKDCRGIEVASGNLSRVEENPRSHGPALRRGMGPEHLLLGSWQFPKRPYHPPRRLGAPTDRAGWGGGRTHRAILGEHGMQSFFWSRSETRSCSRLVRTGAVLISTATTQTRRSEGATCAAKAAPCPGAHSRGGACSSFPIRPACRREINRVMEGHLSAWVVSRRPQHRDRITCAHPKASPPSRPLLARGEK